ncbi:MAG TPA: SDR family oxidoreductase [Ktedonosporobacter sp.]|jgi:3-oxoacyl-[acyl-carrier protein] reductase|nr:SDR family oxidoreductase [Ktedonosporobacter sp.]
MDFGLAGKVALVTAASKGLGRASAAALAAEGAAVVIASRNRETLEQTAQEIRQSGRSTVLAVPADLRQSEEITSLVAKTVNEFGGIDILVNNTGAPPAGIFETISDERWQATFDLIFLSAVRLIRAVLPSMQKRPEGRIIQIVSSSVKQPIAGLLLSNALRPGVVGLAKTLSVELAPYQITVNNVCPGRMLTDRLRQGSSVQKRLAQGLTEEEAISELAKDIPLGRIGNPEELGALVAFLASQQAGYITGTTIQVDGGLIQSLF